MGDGTAQDLPPSRAVILDGIWLPGRLTRCVSCATDPVRNDVAHRASQSQPFVRTVLEQSPANIHVRHVDALCAILTVTRRVQSCRMVVHKRRLATLVETNMERSEATKEGVPRRGRLLRSLDIAATVLSLVGGVAVIVLAAAMYERQRPTPPVDKVPTEPVSIASAAFQGSPTAPFVLVVFSDFQCPYCRDFTHDVLPQVVEKFVRPGTLRLAYIEFPLMGIHPLAKKAALQAVCAGKQDRYWQMHEQLFQPPELDERAMDRFPAAIGLDTNAFKECMNDPATATKVAQDHALSRSLSIPGTPTFYVGVPVGPESVRVLRRFAQARTFDQVAAQLESAMETDVNAR